MKHTVEIIRANATLYFAYGSNMDARQMALRCPNARPFDIGELHGYRLRMDEAGYLTVTACEGSVVEGVLWTLEAAEEETLDRYEGVATRCYEKRRMPVRLPNGESRDALVYASMRRPFTNKTHRADYLARVIEAAKDFHLDIWALPQLREIARESSLGEDEGNIAEELAALHDWLLRAEPLTEGPLWGGADLVIATPEMLERGDIAPHRGYDAIVTRYATDISQALYAVKEAMIRRDCYDRGVYVSISEALDECILSGRCERADLINATFDAAMAYIA